jgi:hypothetical protein
MFGADFTNLTTVEQMEKIREHKLATANLSSIPEKQLPTTHTMKTAVRE